MLKRKILAAVLPVVAAGTVVGSGFSAWYFNENKLEDKSLSIGVDTSSATNQAGNLSVLYNNMHESINNAKVVLDQGSGSNRNSYLHGIGFVSDETPFTTDSDNIVTGGGLNTINFTYKIKTTDYDNLIKANMVVKLTLNVSLNSELLKYVEVSSAKDEENTSNYKWCPDVALEEDNNVYTGDIDFHRLKTTVGSEDEKYYQFQFHIDLSTVNEQNTMLNYHESNAFGEGSMQTAFAKPQKYSEWSNMNSALSSLEGDAIKFTVSAAVVEKTSI